MIMDAGLGLVAELARRLYRARRRAAIAGGLAGLSGTMLYAQIDAFVWSLPFPVFAGLFYAAAITVACLLISALAPGLRHLIELAAIARLTVAMIGFAVPTVGIAIIASPLLSATLVVLGIFFLRSALALPGQPQVAETEVTVTLRSGRSQTALEGLLSRETSSSKMNDKVVMRSYDVRDHGAFREVSIVAAYAAMPLGAWISFWIDDAEGRMADRMIPASVPGSTRPTPDPDLIP